jgi:hypothetical protein
LMTRSGGTDYSSSVYSKFWLWILTPYSRILHQKMLKKEI